MWKDAHYVLYLQQPNSVSDHATTTINHLTRHGLFTMHDLYEFMDDGQTSPTYTLLSVNTHFHCYYVVSTRLPATVICTRITLSQPICCCLLFSDASHKRQFSYTKPSLNQQRM
ncbi:hypothetical protein TNCV_3036071 [Trichonephila clavipes]|nr:hypothetical protein TNCV_3036071 [Trichonephila clavipes]